MTNTANGSAAARPTAWDLFFADPASAEAEMHAALEAKDMLKTLPEGAPVLQAVARKYLMTQVAEQILALLQTLPLGDMLTGGWAHLQPVMQAKSATRTDGSSRNVSLLRHELSFGSDPTVEMLLNEVPVPLLRLALHASFAIDAGELEIVGGEIAHARVGSVGVQATLKSNDITLLDRPLKQLDASHLFG